MTPPRIFTSDGAIFLDFSGDLRRFPFTPEGLTQALLMVPIVNPHLTRGTNLPVKIAPTTKTQRKLRRIGTLEMKALAREVIRGIEVRYK